MRLLLATRNAGKVRELTMALEGHPVEPVSLYPDLPPVVEDGATFLANAVKKAGAIGRATGEAVLADDSGLLVDALDQAPGVHSARFAGPGADDAANNARLLALMREVPPDRRQARFYAVLALALPDGRLFTVDGTCAGVILPALRGEGGFGYDPLFYLPEYGKTMAELAPGLKNRVSHRGRALHWLVRVLDWLLADESA